MLENCQKSQIILQFLAEPMFLNLLMLLDRSPRKRPSLIDPKISLWSKKNSLIAVKTSLLA